MPIQPPTFNVSPLGLPSMPRKESPFQTMLQQMMAFGMESMAANKKMGFDADMQKARQEEGMGSEFLRGLNAGELVIGGEGYDPGTATNIAAFVPEETSPLTSTGTGSLFERIRAGGLYHRDDTPYDAGDLVAGAPEMTVGEWNARSDAERALLSSASPEEVEALGGALVSYSNTPGSADIANIVASQAAAGTLSRHTVNYLSDILRDPSLQARGGADRDRRIERFEIYTGLQGLRDAGMETMAHQDAWELAGYLSGALTDPPEAVFERFAPIIAAYQDFDRADFVRRRNLIDADGWQEGVAAELRELMENNPSAARDLSPFTAMELGAGAGMTRNALAGDRGLRELLYMYRSEGARDPASYAAFATRMGLSHQPVQNHEHNAAFINTMRRLEGQEEIPIEQFTAFLGGSNAPSGGGGGANTSIDLGAQGTAQGASLPPTDRFPADDSPPLAWAMRYNQNWDSVWSQIKEGGGSVAQRNIYNNYVGNLVGLINASEAGDANVGDVMDALQNSIRGMREEGGAMTDNTDRAVTAAAAELLSDLRDRLLLFGMDPDEGEANMNRLLGHLKRVLR